MDSRVAELQQVILKKDLMILHLQRHLRAYEQQFGALDEAALEELRDADSAVVADTQSINTSNSSSNNTNSDTSGVPQEHAQVQADDNATAKAAEVVIDPMQSASEVPRPAPSDGTATQAQALETKPPLPTSPPPPPVPTFSPSRRHVSDPTPAPLHVDIEPPRTASFSSSGAICKVGKNVVLDFVEDSPSFRRQLEGFEESLSGLRGLLKEVLTHTKDYVAAGMRYGEEETALAEEIVHRKYSRALFTTSCPELGSLSSSFAEVHDTMAQLQSSRVSMLLSIEALLHHSIHKFADQELREASELRKEVARLGDEYEALLGKQLGKAKPTGSSNSSSITNSPADLASAGSSTAAASSTGSVTPSGSTSSRGVLEREVLQARLRFEIARFDLVRYLNRLDCQKKFVLLECFNSMLYAFLGHFHACHELVKSIEPGLRKRQEQLQRSRQDFEQDDRMWTTQREALAARLQMDVDNYDVRNGRAASLDVPVQVLSSDTQQSREALLGGVAKQGYLFVRNSMFPARSWKRRWFQIHSGKLYQHRGKHMDLALVCDLMLSRVREASSSTLPFCFEVIDASQAKQLLQATSEGDMLEWIDAARRSTESMLEQQSHRMVVDPAQHTLIQELTAHNASCADCGATPAEWVSINLGCLLCIECSGIHRSLGVHVSKVRSLTLDSWEMPLLALLRVHLGNAVTNAVWEHSPPTGWIHPTPTSSRDDKTKWITAKYQAHAMIEPTTLDAAAIRERFFQAAQDNDLQGLLWCVAHGVDVNVRTDQDLETALHICAQRGFAAPCEYLVVNGASLTLADASGKLPYDTAKASGHEALKLALMQKMSLEQYQF